MSEGLQRTNHPEVHVMHQEPYSFKAALVAAREEDSNSEHPLYLFSDPERHKSLIHRHSMFMISPEAMQPFSYMIIIGGIRDAGNCFNLVYFPRDQYKDDNTFSRIKINSIAKFCSRLGCYNEILMQLQQEDYFYEGGKVLQERLRNLHESILHYHWDELMADNNHGAIDVIYEELFGNLREIQNFIDIGNDVVFVQARDLENACMGELTQLASQSKQLS